MSPSAVIFGLSGPKLTAAESAFFRDANPWGFILFARNIEKPEQVKRLTSELRSVVGRDCLIFIDQEGGRVQRLRPPHWRRYPSGADYAHYYAKDQDKGRRIAYLNFRLIADDLRQIGISANCAPVLDIPQISADPIISDRALGLETEQVVDLAHAVMAGLMTSGVAPVIKHIPGHGRAKVDSHMALPKITESRRTLENSDYLPFRLIHDAPMAMTAHAVYTHASKQPVTVSRKALVEIIRANIGYDGLLMSDDLDMKALSGGLAAKTQKALKAGCDIALQCSGKIKDMVNVAKGVKSLTGRARERALIAQYSAEHISEFDRRETLLELSHLMPDWDSGL